ncbi:hypothetical protein B0H14DRAFT_3518780 [Mycena olivaceomarginata]|nr:hypothetical protein B0H14DRAFT_3518780 [Mycena olivaceomarginata]
MPCARRTPGWGSTPKELSWDGTGASQHAETHVPASSEALPAMALPSPEPPKLRLRPAPALAAPATPRHAPGGVLPALRSPAPAPKPTPLSLSLSHAV